MKSPLTPLLHVAHYPRTVMLGADLKPGKHVPKIRMSPDTKSSGHAMRIIQFVAN